MQKCRNQDIAACEELGAHYLAAAKWDKALIVGEGLCSKDSAMGCTFAGSSLLAQGKVKEAQNFLNKACDKFEPYSCRSLARLMSKAADEPLANMYFKRACYYGLRESCQDVKDDIKLSFSPAGRDYIKKIQQSCQDTESAECSTAISSVKDCSPPLTKQDCELMPGYLSLYFRAKLAQSEAKLSLLSLHQGQKKLQAKPKVNSYSYDLALVMQDQKPAAKYQYAFGFMKSCGRKFNRRKNVTINSLQLWPKSYQHLSARIQANIMAYFSKGKEGDCYKPKIGFEAYAVGNLDPLDPTRLDVWKVDQAMELEHVDDGLPLP